MQEQGHSQYIQGYLTKLSKLKHRCAWLEYDCKYRKRIRLPDWIPTRLFWYYKYGMHLPINGYPLNKGIDFTCDYLSDSIKKTVQKRRQRNSSINRGRRVFLKKPARRPAAKEKSSCTAGIFAVIPPLNSRNFRPGPLQPLPVLQETDTDAWAGLSTVRPSFL